MPHRSAAPLSRPPPSPARSARHSRMSSTPRTRLDVRAALEGVVEVALGLLGLALCDRDAGTRGQCQHLMAARGRRGGFAGPASRGDQITGASWGAVSSPRSRLLDGAHSVPGGDDSHTTRLRCASAAASRRAWSPTAGWSHPRRPKATSPFPSARAHSRPTRPSSTARYPFAHASQHVVTPGPKHQQNRAERRLSTRGESQPVVDGPCDHPGDNRTR